MERISKYSLEKAFQIWGVGGRVRKMYLLKIKPEQPETSIIRIRS